MKVSRKVLLIFSALFLLIFSALAFAEVQPDSRNIFYITPDGTGNCSSWENACSMDNISAIVTYASSNPDSNFSIFLLAGEYTVSSISLASNITIYGGMTTSDTTAITTESSNGKSTVHLNGDITANYSKFYNIFFKNSTTSIHYIYNPYILAWCYFNCYSGLAQIRIYYRWSYDYNSPVIWRSFLGFHAYIYSQNNSQTIYVYNSVIKDTNPFSLSSSNIIKIYNTAIYNQYEDLDSNYTGTFILSGSLVTNSGQRFNSWFVDAGNFNFHLTSDSELLDGGVEITDIGNGLPDIRAVYEPSPNGNAVNIGLYGGTSLAAPTLTFKSNEINCNKNIVRVNEEFSCSITVDFLGNPAGHTFSYKWIISKNGEDNETVKTDTFTYNGSNNYTITDSLTFTKNLYISNNAKLYFIVYDTAYYSYKEIKEYTFNVNAPALIDDNVNVTCDPEIVQYPDEVTSTCSANVNYPYGTLVYEWYINGNLTTTQEGNNLLTINFNSQGETKNIKVKVYPVGYDTTNKWSNEATVISGIPPVIGNVICDNLNPVVGTSITCRIYANNPNDSGILTYQWFKDGQPISDETNDNITYTPQIIQDFVLKAKVCVYDMVCSESYDIPVHVDSTIPEITEFNCSPLKVNYPAEEKTTCSVRVSYPYEQVTAEWYASGMLLGKTNFYESETSSFDVNFTNAGQLKEIQVKVYPTRFRNKFTTSQKITVVSGAYNKVPVSIIFDRDVNQNGGIAPYTLKIRAFLSKEIYKYFLDKIEVLLAKDNDSYNIIGTITDFDNTSFVYIINEIGDYKLKLKSYSNVSSDNNTYETEPAEFRVINIPEPVNGNIKVYKYTFNKIGILFEDIRKIRRYNLLREFREDIVPESEKYTINYDNQTIEITPSRWANPLVIYENDNITNKEINISFEAKTTLNRLISGNTVVDLHYSDTINVVPDVIKKERLTMIIANCMRGRNSICYSQLNSQRFLSERIQSLNWKIYRITENSEELIQEGSGIMLRSLLPDDGNYKIELTGMTTLNREIHGEKVINLQWERNAPVTADVEVHPVKIVNDRVKIIRPRYVYPLTPYTVYTKIKYRPSLRRFLQGWVFEYSIDNVSWQQIGGNFDQSVKGVVFEINHIGNNYFRVRTKNIYSGREYISEPVVFETIAQPEDIENANLPIRIRPKISSRRCMLKFYLDRNDIKNFTDNYLDVHHNESLLLGYKNWKIKFNNSIILEGKRAFLNLNPQEIDNLSNSYIVEVQIPTTLQRYVTAKLELTPDDLKELISSNAFIKDKIEEKFNFVNQEINLDNVSIFHIQNPFNPLFIRYIVNVDGKIMSILRDRGYRIEFDCGDGSIVHNLLNFGHLYPRIGNYVATVKIINSATNQVVKTVSKIIVVNEISQYVQGLLDNNLIHIEKTFFNKVFKTLGLEIRTTPEIAYYLFSKTKRKVYVNGNYVKRLQLIYLPVDYSGNTVDVTFEIYDRRGKVLLARKIYTINIENDFYTEENMLNLVKLVKFAPYGDRFENENVKKRLWGFFEYKWDYDFESILGYKPTRWYSYINFMRRKMGFKVIWKLKNLDTDEIIYETTKKRGKIKILQEGLYQPEIHIFIKLNGEERELVKTGIPYRLENREGNIYVLEFGLFRLPEYRDPNGRYLKIKTNIIYEDPDTLMKTVNYYICGNLIKLHKLRVNKTFLVDESLRGNIPDGCNVKIEVIDKLGKATTKEITVPILNQ